MALSKLLGALSPVHIYFVTLMTGARRIGTDSYGNTYYQARARKGYGHPRRWVIYKGVADPSVVPAEWHGWLHYQTNVVPVDAAPSYRRTWMKPHKPNLTGTDQAYLPQGHILKGFKRAPASGDYTAWVPEAPADNRMPPTLPHSSKSSTV
jgi:NADH:ubiquinone oxidoreductase subunit